MNLSEKQLLHQVNPEKERKKERERERVVSLVCVCGKGGEGGGEKGVCEGGGGTYIE